jgi:hypothetical protein
MPFPIIEYHGQSGLWVESYGVLHTDKYGLSTATAVWVSRANAIAFPAIGSAHPLWNFVHIEKRNVSVEYGHCRTTCEYAGFEGVIPDILEWSSGVNEEPIQTHPDFLSFAGKPSAPLNGSRWVDESGNKTTDDSVGVFDKFWSNPPNKWAGVTSYLLPVPVKRITSMTPSPDIRYTPGFLYGGYLCTSATSTKRGIVYQNTFELRGGGPRGWNTDLY